MSDNITVCTNNKNHTINCVVAHGKRWYRATDVAVALGYKNTKQSVIVHVLIDNKRRLNELKPQAKFDCNEANSIYINEAGLRALVMKSQLPTASDLATQLGISVETRYVRKETEIVGFVQDVLKNESKCYEGGENEKNS